MARSFPIFPVGATGVGIALARAACGLLLALGSVSAGRPDWMELPAVLLAIALVLGMLTRIAALLGALLTVVAAPNLHQAPLVVLLLCAMNIGSLACTGAGAYSIDALLFGRSNIRLPGQG